MKTHRILATLCLGGAIALFLLGTDASPGFSCAKGSKNYCSGPCSQTPAKAPNTGYQCIFHKKDDCKNISSTTCMCRQGEDPVKDPVTGNWGLTKYSCDCRDDKGRK